MLQPCYPKLYNAGSLCYRLDDAHLSALRCSRLGDAGAGCEPDCATTSSGEFHNYVIILSFAVRL